jgi:hypothetical protein
MADITRLHPPLTVKNAEGTLKREWMLIFSDEELDDIERRLNEAFTARDEEPAFRLRKELADKHDMTEQDMGALIMYLLGVRLRRARQA